MAKFIAIKEWSWQNVSVKPGETVPDGLPKDLIQDLLNLENIMPATTAAKSKKDDE